MKQTGRIFLHQYREVNYYSSRQSLLADIARPSELSLASIEENLTAVKREIIQLKTEHQDLKEEQVV
mgnify:CR=1 FL=1